MSVVCHSHFFVKPGVKCPPITLEHSNIQSQDSNIFSDLLQVICDIGYHLIGPSNIQCTESGRWCTLPICNGK